MNPFRLNRTPQKLLDRALLEQAAQALHQADAGANIRRGGQRHSGEYLHYKLLRLGKPAQSFSDMHRATNATTLSKTRWWWRFPARLHTGSAARVKLARKRGRGRRCRSVTPRVARVVC